MSTDTDIKAEFLSFNTSFWIMKPGGRGQLWWKGFGDSCGGRGLGTAGVRGVWGQLQWEVFVGLVYFTIFSPPFYLVANTSSFLARLYKPCHDPRKVKKSVVEGCKSELRNNYVPHLVELLRHSCRVKYSEAIYIIHLFLFWKIPLTKVL